MVPLANMFGYVNQLRSFSQGRAQYTMQFDHYEPVPQTVAQEVQKKSVSAKYLALNRDNAERLQERRDIRWRRQI